MNNEKTQAIAGSVPPACCAFKCQHIGMTMGDTNLEQRADGTWRASAPIGSIFGAKVDGECEGIGTTQEAALAALADDRMKLNDSLWA
jgi:hypothetical protein